MMISRFVSGVVLAVSLTGLGAASSSASPLQTNGNGNLADNGNQGGFGVGLEFTVNSPVSINQLGIYETNVQTTDTVDLLSVTGNILATATFTFGSGPAPASPPPNPNDPPVSGYLFKRITPVSLSAGASYYLMAYGTSSVWELNSTIGGSSETFTTSSLVTYLQSEYVSGDTPGTLPNTPYSDDVFSAGNLQFNAVTATPLPSTWTMLIAGFLGLGFFAWRGSKMGSSAIAAA